MKVEVWAIGKTSEPYLDTGIGIFEKRLKNYLPFTWVLLPNARVKSTDGNLLKQEEGKMVLAKLGSDDYLVLLDERGHQYSSVELARWLEQRLSAPGRRLVFLIGGAFGFSPEIYARANAQISLSRLTFSHQMVRLFFLEQLYRAMTILRNEPYHNE
ncbi:MAG: 23S rRNA (pseudouridine(1915)-N(3))-methyltransferase RlmH [Saprospiraceae bacterium]|jgi:23S rRNA (pseudouridine1915-N3)-methyltransferase|nr:23S rRNA (pseudouridine(1915)-N(3))-methyltransferase RlmH [Saprospiraceae bacterium]